MNIVEDIQSCFQIFLAQKYQISREQARTFQLSIHTDSAKADFGDMSSQAAMVLAKETKQNPQLIARTIADSFTHPSISRIDIAGPGFLNMFLTDAAYQTLAQDLFDQQRDFFLLSADTPRHNFLVEFVSANPTGPLHIGHGRGGIIGDVLSRILNFIGHSAVKEFYINDAGAQIQKLGQAFKIRCLQALGLPVDLPEDSYHGDYLIDLARICINEHSDILDKHESFFEIYAKEHLLHHIQSTLKEYGITFDVWFSEKTLHTHGAIDHAIKMLKDKQFTYERDNALWFTSTQFGDDKDRVLKKSTGELTYAAADIAYIENKVERKFDRLVYILGQDHHSYVTRLKGIMAALGYNPDHLQVILYQLVTLKNQGEAVRMSKRAGKIVALSDIIEIVGTDVARFFFLNKKADSHLEFDIGLALKKTDENPVYYIQYASVRAHSIIRKAYADPALQSITAADIHPLHEDHVIIKKIISLKSLLETMSFTYQTHLLTYYTLELAQTFHSYYNQHKVIDAQNIPLSRSRIALILIIKNTLETCLNLLGISCPETM